MKKILISSMFLISSLTAYAGITQDYSVSFSSRFSDSKGKDTGCGAYIVPGGSEMIPDPDYTAIRIVAEGTGRWIDLKIPVNRIPLKNGDSFIVKNVTGDKKVTYENGTLSYELVNINDELSAYYWHDIGMLKIDENLTNISYADVSYVRIEKAFFGGKKLVADMRLKCVFY